MSFIDQKKFNDNEFNKVKLEVDMANNTLKDTSDRRRSKKNAKDKDFEDIEEDMQYDVTKIREKLNHTIDEINTDP